MNKNNETREPRRRWTSVHVGRDHWLSLIAYAVTVAVTAAAASAVTAVTVVLVLAAGLWLAYLYLPGNVFSAVLAVLVADVSLGIVIRATRKRKRR